MDRTEISIIVPVYRIRDYLSQCLESLLHQDFSHPYNILLIETNSDDGSDLICQEYQKKYPNVFHYHYPKHYGISFARDLGLLHANGDYVTFVDGDDYVSSDFLSTLFAPTEKNPDLYIVSGNYEYVFPDGKIKKHKADGYSGNGRKALKHLFSSSEMSGYCWARLFSRKFLLANHLFFNTDINIYEDFLFMGCCFREAYQVISLKKSVYYYRQHEKSTLATTKDTLQPYLQALRLMREDYHFHNQDAERIIFSSLPSGIKKQMKQECHKSQSYYSMKEKELYRHSLKTLQELFKIDR